MQSHFANSDALAEVVYSPEVSNRESNLLRELEKSVQTLEKDLMRVGERLPEKLGERLGALEQHRDYKPHWAMPVVLGILGTAVLAGLIGYLTWLGRSVSQIRVDVAGIRGDLATDKLKGTVLSPELHKSSLVEATDVLQRAAKEDANIAKTVRVAAGQRLVDVSNNDPSLQDEAWQAFLALLDYVSSIDSSHIPPAKDAKLPGTNEPITLMVPGLYPNQPMGDKVLYAGFDKPPNSALMEHIGQGLDKANKIGPSYWIVHDAPILLDGWHLKRVIFKRCRLVYRGGPVQLDTVYFADCRFQFERSNASAAQMSIHSSMWQFLEAFVYPPDS
jgi:hypothetical protein